MRSVTEVTNKMVEQIPGEEETLKNELLKIFESVQWAPPEQVKSTYYWNRLAVVLNKFISEEDYKSKEWCKNVINIFQEPTSVSDL
jgi:mRNA-degrading endonuclease HigB of HigAB toxin-antitoxin module